MNKILIQLQFYSAFALFSIFSIFQRTNLRWHYLIKVPGYAASIMLRHEFSDFRAFRQLFLLNQGEIEVKGISPKVIIDAGANIGLHTLKLKKKFPEAKIICIEPDPDNFKSLHRNVGHLPNVYLEQAGLWQKDTQLTISNKYSPGKWAMVVQEDPSHGTLRGISMDTLLEKYAIHHVDILKLDIETSEKYLFSENTSAWLPRNRMIMIELHDRFLPGCSEAFFGAVKKSFTQFEQFESGEYTVVINSTNLDENHHTVLS